MSGKKHILAGKSSGKTHFLPDIGPAKFRQSIYLSTKYALSDILTAKVVEQSSGKIENCRQNMLCRTFFRQKYAICRTFSLNKMSGKIILSTNVCFPGRQAQAAGLPAGRPSRPAQNHTVDKYMLSGPAGLGGRAAYIIQSTVF